MIVLSISAALIIGIAIYLFSRKKEKTNVNNSGWGVFFEEDKENGPGKNQNPKSEDEGGILK